MDTAESERNSTYKEGTFTNKFTINAHSSELWMFSSAGSER